jgi:MFS transporter, DHA1 family, inner membrane transport protein
MSFFANDAVNRVNLHAGVRALAETGGAIFFFVFLLRSGVSVPTALMAQAAIMAMRFALRPAILPLAKRWGLKPMVILGTVLMAFVYPLLGLVDGLGAGLVALCIAVAIAEVVYWPSYNAYFAALGDPEHRGHQVSAREALVSAASIVAPLLGAWSLIAFGPGLMLAAVAIVQLAAVLPLLGAPSVPVRQTAPGLLRSARLGIALYAADGWTDAYYLYVWQIALYLTLGQSVMSYGGAMALAGAAGAFCGLVLGKRIDAGHGRLVVALVFSAAGAVMTLRAASVGMPALAVIANALGPFVMTLMSPALGAANYNLAKASPCPMRFLIAADGGWDIGCLSACLLAAALASAEVGLSVTLLLALPALAVQALLLRHYFGGLER